MRKAVIARKTKETEVTVELNLDGQGRYEIETGLPFFNHMLELFSRHGLFNLKVLAKGDLEVDAHHTVEDVGICLGQALKKALGEKKGISRYGHAVLPMDEALVLVAVDVSGRGQLFYQVDLPIELIGSFDTTLVKEFWQAFVNQAEVTLHLKSLSGYNSHHIIEAVFKGTARALDVATQIDRRSADVPSTKGNLGS